MLRARCGLDAIESTPAVLGPSVHASSNISTSNERTTDIGGVNKMGNTSSGSLGSSTSSLSSGSSAGMVSVVC